MTTEIEMMNPQNVSDSNNINNTNSMTKEETPSLKTKTSQQQQPQLLPNMPPYYTNIIPPLNYPPDPQASPNQRPILPSRFIPFRYQQQPFYYFLTTSSHQHKESHIFEQTGELLLLAVIIGLWLSAIAVFLHRWRSIRIVRAPETRLASYRPKNLETIKIVTKHRDSVIYKNLPENMSRTLEARQKRLSRMSTVPNIKLGEQFQQLLPQPQSLLFNPLLLQQQQQQQSKEQPVYCFGRPQSLPQLQEFLQHQLLQQLHLMRQTQHTNLQTTLSPQQEEEDELLEQEEQQNTVVSMEEAPKSSSPKENVNHIPRSESTHPSDPQEVPSSEQMETYQQQLINPTTTTQQQHSTNNNVACCDENNKSVNHSSVSLFCSESECSQQALKYGIPTASSFDGASQITLENETKSKNSEDEQFNLPAETDLLLKRDPQKFQSKPKAILKSRTKLVLQPLLQSSDNNNKTLEKPL